MFWSTVNFNTLIVQLLPVLQRKPRTITLLQSFINPLQKIHNDIVYRQQHDGTTISLEKMLNDFFEVAGYDCTNHDNTKTIYIENVPFSEALYVFQDDEAEVNFLEDDGDDNGDDIFLDNDIEGNSGFLFTIYIPDTYLYQEGNLRAVIDGYRYIGTKYNIQTYEL